MKAAKRAADNLAESEKEVADAREAVSKAKGDLDQYDSLTKRRNTAIDEIRKAAEREERKPDASWVCPRLDPPRT